MTPYEMRFQILGLSESYLFKRYDHEQRAFESGLIPHPPAFPEEAEILQFATTIRDFVDKQ